LLAVLGAENQMDVVLRVAVRHIASSCHANRAGGLVPGARNFTIPLRSANVSPPNGALSSFPNPQGFRAWARLFRAFLALDLNVKKQLPERAATSYKLQAARERLQKQLQAPTASRGRAQLQGARKGLLSSSL